MSVTQRGGNDDEAYEPISRTILETVAAHEGVEPSELEPPLHDVVDPDALNSLFAPTSRGHSRTSGKVVFAYSGYKVTAHSDGRVEIRESDEETVEAQSSQDAFGQ